MRVIVNHLKIKSSEKLAKKSFPWSSVRVLDAAQIVKARCKRHSVVGAISDTDMTVHLGSGTAEQVKVKKQSLELNRIRDAVGDPVVCSGRRRLQSREKLSKSVV